MLNQPGRNIKALNICIKIMYVYENTIVPMNCYLLYFVIFYQLYYIE
jgi:hypothetical protein